MNILVTAANGNLGREIVAQLSARVDVVAGVRKLEQARPGNRVTYKQLDYDQPATYADALDGIDAVVLQAPPLDAGALQRMTPFIDAMRNTGINRVVLISAYGVDHNDAAPLRQIELKLIADGFNYTLLRPSFFMENFSSGFAAQTLRQDSAVVASAGDGKIVFVSIRDIAAMATQVLTVTGHDKTAYNLTGGEALSHGDVATILSEALSHGDVATILSEALGKPVQYVSLSHDALKAGAMEHGMPESAADYLITLFDLAKRGLFATPSNDIESVLGRAPTPFKAVAASI